MKMIIAVARDPLSVQYVKKELLSFLGDNKYTSLTIRTLARNDSTCHALAFSLRMNLENSVDGGTFLVRNLRYDFDRCEEDILIVILPQWEKEVIDEIRKIKNLHPDWPFNLYPEHLVFLFINFSKTKGLGPLVLTKTQKL